MKIKILSVITGVIVLAVAWGIFASFNKPNTPAVSAPAIQALQPPTGLKVSPVSDTQVNLSWAAPLDSTGVVGYLVYRDEIKIGTTLATVYSDSTYTSSSRHAYKIVSYNSQGKVSVFSNAVNVPQKSPVTVNPTPVPVPAPVPAPAPVPTPVPVPVPQPPPPAACGSGGACTATQVAAHHTQADCWVYLSPINKTYNITAFVANPNTHPGGNVIISHCGTNIYDFFIGNAGGNRHSNTSLNSILQSYYIGPFQP